MIGTWAKQILSKLNRANMMIINYNENIISVLIKVNVLEFYLMIENLFIRNLIIDVCKGSTLHK